MLILFYLLVLCTILFIILLFKWANKKEKDSFVEDPTVDSWDAEYKDIWRKSA